MGMVMKVLLGVTGSVAAILMTKLASALAKDHEIQGMGTQASIFFLRSSEVRNAAMMHDDDILDSFVFRTDSDEWSLPSSRMTNPSPADSSYKKDQEILHIQLRDWADILVIAPLSANTLAKLANGMCDNLVTSVARAWDIDNKPVVLAPAMNTKMYMHPATFEHLMNLERWIKHLTVVPPQDKELACGETGLGAMAHIDDIVRAVKAYA